MFLSLDLECASPVADHILSSENPVQGYGFTHTKLGKQNPDPIRSDPLDRIRETVLGRWTRVCGGSLNKGWSQYGQKTYPQAPRVIRAKF